MRPADPDLRGRDGAHAWLGQQFGNMLTGQLPQVVLDHADISGGRACAAGQPLQGLNPGAGLQVITAARTQVVACGDQLGDSADAQSGAEVVARGEDQVADLVDHGGAVSHGSVSFDQQQPCRFAGSVHTGIVELIGASAARAASNVSRASLLPWPRARRFGRSTSVIDAPAARSTPPNTSSLPCAVCADKPRTTVI